MANTIKLKRASSSDPSASDLSVGELAIRTSNCKLFSKNDGGSAVGIVAGSADVLTTARTIAGVSFDGSANISLNNNAITNGAGYIADLVSDTSPQLGGDLDMNSRSISSGILNIKNTGSQSEVRLYCEVSNAHYVSIKAPAHSTYSGNLTYTLPPTVTNGYFLQTNGSGVLSWAAVDLTALSASNLTSGTIPDARFPSTLPALNGSALTNLNGSNIASGTIAAARVATLNQDTTGNAATATALETARTIAGVSFDGTANISLNNNAITNGAGYLADIVSDTSPQLGGTLDLNGNYIEVADGGPNTNQEHIRFGNDGDLRIYHDSTDSYIADTGTGQLKLATNQFRVVNAANNENLISANEDGYVRLYYDNALVFETRSGGFGGDDNDKLFLGNSSDLQMYHDGSNSYLDNDTGTFIIRSDGGGLKLLSEGNIILRDNDDTTNLIRCINGGQIELYNNGTKTFETIAGGAKLQGGEGVAAHLYMFADEGDDNADKWVFRADASSSQLKLRNYASGSWEESIIANGNGSVELHYDNSKKFETTSDGASVTGHLKSYHLKPMANNTYDVGTTSLKWRDVYATNFHGDGSNLTGISAGATGGGSDEIFYENGQNVTTDYTITNGKNAMCAGPITINSGVTVTVGSGETLTIV